MGKPLRTTTCGPGAKAGGRAGGCMGMHAVVCSRVVGQPSRAVQPSCGTIGTRRSNMISELDVIILMCQIAFSRAGGSGGRSERKRSLPPGSGVASLARREANIFASPPLPSFPFSRSLYLSLPFFLDSPISLLPLSLSLSFFLSSAIFVIYNQCNYVHTRGT